MTIARFLGSWLSGALAGIAAYYVFREFGASFTASLIADGVFAFFTPFAFFAATK